MSMNVDQRDAQKWAERWRAEADRVAIAEAKLLRIKRLHRPDGSVGGPGAMCVECTPDFGTPHEEPVPWPCATMRIIQEVDNG